MQKVKIGLLPLYIALYDDCAPGMRPGIEAFYERIAEALEARGLDVLRSPICRVENEFKAAVSGFEADGAQVLITLHMAYSPSLEAEKVLAGTKLPLLVLDTTPDYHFNYSIDSDAIDYNHGIHGVQDMCNLLLRNRKPFEIFVGHYLQSDVLDRIARAAHVAACAFRLGTARVGLVGESFKGMGDFKISKERFAALGISVAQCDLDKLAGHIRAVTQEEIDAEYALDSEACDMTDVARDVYDASARAGLAVRRWIEEEKLTGFSMNFLEAGLSEGFPTIPFDEACKAMARGVGYAGEGDALTAALVGALLTNYQDATFAEMFCPDWANDTIYFSHMGEYNLRVADGKPRMIVPPFPYAPGFAPTRMMGHFKPGKVCLVNLAPGADDYTLVLAEGEMIKLPDDIGSFSTSVSGWFKPGKPLTEFLAAYSRVGGTHHSALVYGATAEEMKLFARLMGFKVAVL